MIRLGWSDRIFNVGAGTCGMRTNLLWKRKWYVFFLEIKKNHIFAIDTEWIKQLAIQEWRELVEFWRSRGFSFWLLGQGCSMIEMFEGLNINFRGGGEILQN